VDFMLAAKRATKDSRSKTTQLNREKGISMDVCRVLQPQIRNTNGEESIDPLISFYFQ
jgi:hypothetical protein